jgi:hypothetical protein
MADELDFWMQQLVGAAQAVGRENFSADDLRSLDDTRKKLRAYVESRATPEPSEEADGWQLVPKVPTEEMESAGWIDKEDVCPCDIYTAMLAAAPQPPAIAALRAKGGAR